MGIAATRMARAQRMILRRSSPRCSVSVIVVGDLIDGRLAGAGRRGSSAGAFVVGRGLVRWRRSACG